MAKATVTKPWTPPKSAKTPFARFHAAFKKACTLSNNGKHAEAEQVIAPSVDELETIPIPADQLYDVAGGWHIMGTCAEGLRRPAIAMAWYARALAGGHDSTFLSVCDLDLSRSDFEAVLRCTEPLLARIEKSTQIDLWCWLRIYRGHAAIATGRDQLARSCYDDLRVGWPNHLSRARLDLEQLSTSSELARSILATFPAVPQKQRSRR